ncbi:MAG: PUR family DNA/RNA-binding protein [Cryomorphaceae bacterium]|nr:PUR family DNA/RNA-binding protein [Cryomorphaceae bacterium]
MKDHDKNGQDEIFSNVLRAGRRTYFFDVRSTRADDYYLTITESKKFFDDSGEPYFKKHKIYLYKEDFAGFIEMLKDSTSFIIDQKGEEVISDKHDPNYVRPASENENGQVRDFTNIDFDDI